MFIKPTKEAKGDLLEIHEDAIDILLYAANEDVPCPWDAGIYAEDGKVVLEGSLAPGGPRGATCICTCTVEDFTKYYKLEVPNDNDELISALAAAGWVAV